MRGDHGVVSNLGCLFLESPPHARGPLTVAQVGDLSDGITPACAGTTSCTA